MVAAEDTRRSRALLSHLGAHPKLLSHHAHSGPAAGAAVLAHLARGDDVALVTDAGTPGISDPGADLVASARAAGVPVVPIPGPSAVTAALSAAGLPADRWVFLGFLPRKGGERERLLERVAVEEFATVLFEAPGRVAALLADLASRCGGSRGAVVARELTKLHEEIRAGTLDELAAGFGGAPAEDGAVRGECTIIVAGTPPAPDRRDDDRARDAARRLVALGVSRKDAAALVSDLFGTPRNEAYRFALEAPR